MHTGSLIEDKLSPYMHASFRHPQYLGSMRVEDRERQIIEMFGQVMHERRTALQLRLVDLESDYGIKRSQISRIEDGKTQICLIGIFQIAEGLDMTPSELIAEVHRRIVYDNTR